MIKEKPPTTMTKDLHTTGFMIRKSLDNTVLSTG